MFVDSFNACVYNMASFLDSTNGLLFWKYFEMTFTSLFDFAGRGRGETFLMVTRMGLVISLLLLLVEEVILEVNLDEIFTLNIMALLSI